MIVDKDFGIDEKGRIRLGETTSSGKGGRLIQITDIGDTDTMSVVLGHEAYRNGVVDGNNRSETRNAVIAHTEMADRMRADGTEFSGIVGLDLAMYDYARSVGNMDIMAAYADSLYDSSGEYWRVIKDSNGNVVQVLDDKDMAHATIVDADGNIEKIADLDVSPLTIQLAAIVGNGMSGERMNQIMVASGLWWENVTEGWHVRGEEKKPEINEVPLSPVVENNNTNWLTSAAGKAGTFLGNIWGGIKNTGSYIKDKISDLFGLTKTPVINEAEIPKTEAVKPPLLTSVKFNQEMLEKALGLPKYSACFLTADTYINYAYQRENGNYTTPDEMINSLKRDLDKLHNSEGDVIHNAVGSALFGNDGLEYVNEYTSLDALKEAGYEYYLEVRGNNGGGGMHAIGWANGVKFDPDKTTTTRWWETDNTSAILRYRVFRPRGEK
jgi:hypothetical protein